MSVLTDIFEVRASAHRAGTWEDMARTVVSVPPTAAVAMVERLPFPETPADYKNFMKTVDHLARDWSIMGGHAGANNWSARMDPHLERDTTAPKDFLSVWLYENEWPRVRWGRGHTPLGSFRDFISYLNRVDEVRAQKVPRTLDDLSLRWVSENVDLSMTIASNAPVSDDRWDFFYKVIVAVDPDKNWYLDYTDSVRDEDPDHAVYHNHNRDGLQISVHSPEDKWPSISVFVTKWNDDHDEESYLAARRDVPLTSLPEILRGALRGNVSEARAHRIPSFGDMTDQWVRQNPERAMAALEHTPAEEVLGLLGDAETGFWVLIKTVLGAATGVPWTLSEVDRNGDEEVAVFNDRGSIRGGAVTTWARIGVTVAAWPRVDVSLFTEDGDDEFLRGETLHAPGEVRLRALPGILKKAGA